MCVSVCVLPWSVSTLILKKLFVLVNAGAYVCEWIGTLVHECGGQVTISGVLLHHSLCALLREGLSLNLGFLFS